MYKVIHGMLLNEDFEDLKEMENIEELIESAINDFNSYEEGLSIDDKEFGPEVGKEVQSHLKDAFEKIKKLKDSLED